MKRIVGIFVALALLMIHSACGDGPVNPRDYLFNGTAIAETANPSIPIVAAHENGEVMAVLAHPDGSLGGGVYRDASGRSFTVFVDRFGRPSVAVAGGYLVVFDGYRGSRVNVAIMHPNGEVEVKEAIETGVDWDLHSSLAASAADELSLDLTRTVQLTALALSVASCAAGVATGVGAIALALPCTAAIVSIVKGFKQSDDPAVRASTGGLGVAAGGIGCGAMEPFSCASLIAEVAALILGTAENEVKSEEEAVANARSFLRFGGVWKRRDVSQAYFVITPTRAADRIWAPTERCWWGNTGVFVRSDGDLFTYRVEDGSQWEVTFKIELTTEEVLRIQRISDAKVWLMDRTALSADGFSPSCEGYSVSPFMSATAMEVGVLGKW